MIKLQSLRLMDGHYLNETAIVIAQRRGGCCVQLVDSVLKSSPVLDRTSSLPDL